MQQVNDIELAALRERNVLSESEVAYTQGDLLVAMNVVTEEKRILGKANDLLTEASNKRVLKG